MSPLQFSSGRISSVSLRASYTFLFLTLLAPVCAQQPNSLPVKEQQVTTATGGAGPRPPEIRTASSPAGSITGRIAGEEGRPLAGVTVILFGIGNSASQRSTSTDSDGRFQISGLAPAAYVLQAVLPGYVAPPDASFGVDEPRYYRVGDSVDITMVKGGVITGTVINANGEPVAAAPVRAVRVHGDNKNQLRSFYLRERATDDRGVYRLYGLDPGQYLVSAGGSRQYNFLFNAYDLDVPTYYPSATRDTATQVTVRSGEETGGVDIRYRGERGHTISGRVSGSVESTSPSAGISVTLTHAASGSLEAMTYSNGRDGGFPFALDGVADGEYILSAYRWAAPGKDAEAAYSSRRIAVKGSDMTGLELKLTPLGSIAGRVMLEATRKPGCADQSKPSLEEVIIVPRRTGKKTGAQPPPLPFIFGSSGTPNNKGEFTLRYLTPGSYRLEAHLPGDAWYVRAVTVPRQAAGAPAGSANAGRSSGVAQGTVTLKAGETFTGVNISLAQGAAGVRGRVTAPEESVALPARLHIYLVPAERERIDDTLRYAEAPVNSDGTFALDGLAPGRYRFIARPAPDESSSNNRLLLLDADYRARLRREAEDANTALDLQECQHVTDYVLRYAPAAPNKAVPK